MDQQQEAPWFLWSLGCGGKRLLLTHSSANLDLRIRLNSAEVMEGNEGERDIQWLCQQLHRQPASCPHLSPAATEDL